MNKECQLYRSYLGKIHKTTNNPVQDVFTPQRAKNLTMKKPATLLAVEEDDVVLTAVTSSITKLDSGYVYKHIQKTNCLLLPDNIVQVCDGAAYATYDCDGCKAMQLIGFSVGTNRVAAFVYYVELHDEDFYDAYGYSLAIIDVDGTYTQVPYEISTMEPFTPEWEFSISML